VYNSKASLGLRGNTSRNTRRLCPISNMSWNGNKEKQNYYTKRLRHTLFTKLLQIKLFNANTKEQKDLFV